MDQRLFKAARSGDVAALNILLEEDPLILEKLSLSPTAENPLHIAALAGQTDFAKDMMRKMPSFAREQNQYGSSPMHMASARGNIEIVREILTLGPDLCLVKDKGGRISLHYAAMKGTDHVVEELLSQCPKAIEVLTARGETAFHLAVKNKQFEAFRVLVERLENMDNRYWKLINAKDEEGNTILELAISTNQHQVLDLLHGKGDLLGLKQVNAATELETNILLENQSQEIVSNSISDPMQLQLSEKSAQNKHETSDIQNAILVAASLIAAVTYQAGLSPPPSIWKEGMKVDTKCIRHRFTHPNFRLAFLGPPNSCPSYTFFIFMIFNTAGFLSSIFLILCWRAGIKAQVILLAASLSFMVITYETLALSMAPNVLSFLFIYLITCIVLTSYMLAIRSIEKTSANAESTSDTLDVPRVGP